jgi:transcriptional regulator EpsA
VTDVPRLDDIDRERFAEAVEAAFAIANRQQFFVWTQSSLQGLVPHEVLLCGIEESSLRGMEMYRFTASRYFKQENFDALCDPMHGLMPPLLAAAERTRQAVVMCPAESDAAADADLRRLVEGNELKNLAARLVSGTSGRVDAFYAFGRISARLDRRLGYMVELVTPHLHGAFLRVLSHEREVQGSSRRRPGRIVTPRQEEILQLIKHGKTNAEIAAMLDCSPWTVKNHIQAILKKLDTNSRSHAIAKAMSLGILKPD